MDNFEKKFAIWLLTRKYARDLEEAKEYAKAIIAGECPEAMVEFNKKNMDVIMELGKVTQETMAPYMQKKLEFAKTCIRFWEEHVKDTNAIFFRRKYEENFGTYE